LIFNCVASAFASLIIARDNDSIFSSSDLISQPPFLFSGAHDL
jgi:hypothetical protein